MSIPDAGAKLKMYKVVLLVCVLSPVADSGVLTLGASGLRGWGVARCYEVPGLSVQEHLNEVVSIIAAKGNEDRLPDPGPRKLCNSGGQWPATLKKLRRALAL